MLHGKLRVDVLRITLLVLPLPRARNVLVTESRRRFFCVEHKAATSVATQHLLPVALKAAVKCCLRYLASKKAGGEHLSLV